ncbi:MAG TPA: peptidase C15 [Chroococcales cyanobacterium]
MSRKILLTSFQTWRPEQKSNSSDDLLEKIAQDTGSDSLTFLRQLPVNIPEAASRVITKIEEVQPDAIICCGMAQSRQKLTIESRATCGNSSYRIRLYSYWLAICRKLNLNGFEDILPIFLGIGDRSDLRLIRTSVNLVKLLDGLSNTEISHEAGKFVCEGLYYELLKYLRKRNLATPCIFVHVPILTPENLPVILADFQLIIEKMSFAPVFY